MARDQIRYLSPIVMMELLAGGRKPELQKDLDRLFAPYSKAQRLIHLQSSHYYKAGECLARLAAKRKEIHLGLSHDILIAVSALSVGATLFTTNRKDFIQIRNFLPVKLEFL
jgi:predicted nucleic acid-binding protein